MLFVFLFLCSRLLLLIEGMFKGSLLSSIAYIPREEPVTPPAKEFNLKLIIIIAGSAGGALALVWIVVCIYCKCCRGKRSEEDEPELMSIHQQDPDKVVMVLACRFPLLKLFFTTNTSSYALSKLKSFWCCCVQLRIEQGFLETAQKVRQSLLSLMDFF